MRIWHLMTAVAYCAGLTAIWRGMVWPLFFIEAAILLYSFWWWVTKR
jgi:hypothetical protein